MHEGHIMTRLRLAVLLLVGAFLPALPLSAQQVEAAPAGGPRLERTAAAMRTPVADRAEATMQARTNSMGKPVALIVVGGAAIILGAVVGDEVGTLLSIGGAIALLYGLYLYLR
jgi:hypothetical protein